LQRSVRRPTVTNALQVTLHLNYKCQQVWPWFINDLLDRELVDIGSLIRRAAAAAMRIVPGGELALDIPLDTIHSHGDPMALGEALTGVFSQIIKQAATPITCQASVRQAGSKIEMRFQGSVSMDGQQLELPEKAVHVINQHGGQVKGNTMNELEVELPLAVMGGNRKDNLDMEDRKGKCRVLVVDDNVDGAVTLSVIIKHMGHSVRITHDGAAALTVAQEFRPELILMDIGMPGMDGYETCQRMRREEWSSGVHIVALTGWGQEEDKRKAMRAGFDRHLVKPVDRKTLIDVLNSVPAPASDGRNMGQG
jgi:CheY-like chemotaxis protein